MRLRLGEQSLGLVEAALPAAQLGEPHGRLGHPERADRGQVSALPRQHRLGLGPVAVPGEHRRVVGAADAVHELDPHPLRELLELLAPLAGAVEVAHPLAGVDQVAAGPADGLELLVLAAERRRRRLVQTAHPLLNRALADQRQPLCRQPDHLEVRELPGPAQLASLRTQPPRRGGVAVLQRHRALEGGEPAMLR